MRELKTAGRKAFVFSDFVIGYLFLGGTGAGALVVLCLLECANVRRRFGSLAERTRLGLTFSGRAMPPRQLGRMNGAAGAFALPGEFFARAWLVCLVVLACAIACLAFDLGRFDRLFNLLFTPRLSIMTVGAYVLAASFVIAMIFAALALLDNVFPGPGFVYVLSVVGVLVGVATMVYTGVLLSSLASVRFWQTPLLPVLFTVSSLSCGIACVLFSGVFVEARQPVVAPLARLAHIDGFVILAEAVVLVAYLTWGMWGDATVCAAYALIAGGLAWLFWGGLVTVGLVVPFVMERFVAYGNYRSQLVWIAAAVLLGGFIMRLCFVDAGLYDATQAGSVASGLIGEWAG